MQSIGLTGIDYSFVLQWTTGQPDLGGKVADYMDVLLNLDDSVEVFLE